MIPQQILEHLSAASVPYAVRIHSRAVTAQELAASVHVSGSRVAKSVLVEADGRRIIAVLPATEFVDRDRLAAAIGASRLRFLREDEFAGLFPGCELGAEPPFGSLYGLPVVVDRSLAVDEPLVLRAGSHEEALEMGFDDFARLEGVQLADFAVHARMAPRVPVPAHPA